MSDQHQAVNEAVSIIGNLLRMLETKGSEIQYLFKRMDVKDKSIETANDQVKYKNEEIDKLRAEIETMKKKEGK